MNENGCEWGKYNEQGKDVISIENSSSRKKQIELWENCVGRDYKILPNFVILAIFENSAFQKVEMN